MMRDGPATAPTGLHDSRLLTFQLDATEPAVRDALDTIGHMLQQHLSREPVCDTTQIVLAEALNNVVEHAYAGQSDGTVTVRLKLETDRISVEVQDWGLPMPNGQLPGNRMPQADNDDLQGLPEGGFGWAMLHCLTTGLAYNRTGEQNILRFDVPKLP